MFFERNKGSSHSIRYVKVLIWCLVAVGFALILLILTGTENTKADTVVPGGPVCDDPFVSPGYNGPWDATGSPYWVEGDIWVPSPLSPPGSPDNTLTIDGSLGPVDIRFNGSYSFRVGLATGNVVTLKANSKGGEIYFRSNGTGITWQGIEFTTDSSAPIPNDSILEGALIENVTGGPDTAVWLNGASNVNVSNCEIRSVTGIIDGYGIRLFNSMISTDDNFVMGNRITGVTGVLNTYGIYLENADGNVIYGNTIENVISIGGGTSWGIQLWDSSINTVSLNDIRNISGNGDDAIGIELFFDSDGNSIAQNNITNVTNTPGTSAITFGIRMWGAPGFATPDQNDVIRNTVRQIYSEQSSSQGIMLWDEPTGNRIGGNLITNISTGPLGFEAYGIIVLNNYRNIIENNEVSYVTSNSGTMAFGMYYADSENDIIMNNTFYNISSSIFAYGIFKDNSYNTTFYNITIYNVTGNMSLAIPSAIGLYSHMSVNNTFDLIRIWNISGLMGPTIGLAVDSSENESFSNITVQNVVSDTNVARGIYSFFSVNTSFVDILVENVVSFDNLAIGIVTEMSDNEVFRDTVVERVSGVDMTIGFAVGSIDIEIVGLELRSIEPIQGEAIGLYSGMGSMNMQIRDSSISDVSTETLYSEAIGIFEVDSFFDIIYNVDIQNITSKNGSSIGIMLDGSTNVTIEDSKIDNVTARGNMSIGIEVNEYTYGTVLYNNTIVNITNKGHATGIYTGNETNGTRIQKNTIYELNSTSGKVHGIMINESRNLTVSDNIIEISDVAIPQNSVAIGAYYDKSSTLPAVDVTIVRNWLFGPGFATGLGVGPLLRRGIGLLADPVDGIVIEDNTVTGMIYGIYIMQDTTAIVGNNSIFNNTNGIWVINASTIVMYNNIVCDNLNWGLWMDNTSSGTWSVDTQALVANNQIRFNGTINVISGRMTFYNVYSSEVGSVTIGSAGLMELGASPSSVVSKSLRVNGIMYINSSKWEINCTTSNGQYGIQVSGTGTMIIQDNGTGPSIITDSPYDNDSGTVGVDDFRYNFKVLTGATFRLTDSEVSEVGHVAGGFNDRGLYIQTTDSTISNCKITNGYYGIIIQGGGWVFDDNEIEDVDSIGMWVEGAAGTTIVNSTINTTGNVAYAILLSDNGHWVENNTITTSGGSSCYGIYLSAANGVNIVDNNITTLSNQGHGIVFSSSGDNFVINNTITVTSNNAYGVYLLSMGNFIINNTITGGGAGVRMENSVWNKVTDNKLFSSNYGIWVRNGARALLRNNEIYDNFIWGIYVDYSSSSIWTVDSYASLINNPARLNGNVTVISGKLRFYNVSAEILNLSINQYGLMEVEESLATVLSQNVWVDGMLYVNSSKWEINCTTANGEYGIQVNGTGTMIIQDTGTGPSTVTDSPYDNDGGTLGLDNFRYYFRVLTGATFRLLDSEVSEVGWTDIQFDQGGLFIETQDAAITDSYILRNFVGVHIMDGGWTISGNVFDNLNQTGIYVHSTTLPMQITSNIINTTGEDGIGIYFSQSASYNNITGNIINTSGENGYGIYIYISSSFNRFVNNTIDTYGYFSMGIYTWQFSVNNTFTENIIKTTGDLSSGIYLRGDSINGTITGNNITIFGSDANGVYLNTDSSNGIISDNQIKTYNSTASGIEVNYSPNATIKLNEIDTYGLGGWGIVVSHSEDTVVEQNNITTSNITSWGIDISYSNNCIVTNNMVLTFSVNSRGIFLDSSWSTNISHNSIITLGNNAYGIYLISSSDCEIVNNTINTNETGIYLLSSSDNNLIFDNDIVTNKTDSIGVWVWGSQLNNITENSIETHGVNGYGIWFWDTTNNTVWINDITTTGDGADGIYFWINSNNNSLYSNTINTSGSDAHGISFLGSDRNLITNNLINVNPIDSNGIELSGSANNTIRQDTMSGFNQAIRMVSDSDNNIIYNGNFTNNQNFAIYMDTSSVNQWIITTDATGINDKFIIHGILWVKSGGNLQLRQVLLRVDDVFVDSGGTLTVYESMNTVFSDDVWIEGYTEINNTVWKINNTYDGEHRIQVNSTGNLVLVNGSIISAYDPVYHYDFWVDGSATFLDSTVEYVGYSFDIGSTGIFVTNPNVSFNNMVIRHSMAAIGFEGVSGSVINSEIYNCTVGIALFNGSGIVLDNLDIHDMFVGMDGFTVGIVAENYSNVIITNATIENLPSLGFSTGIMMNWAQGIVIQNVNITNVTGFGIFADNSSASVDNVFMDACIIGVQTENSSLYIQGTTIANQGMLALSVQVNSFVEYINGHIFDAGGFRVAYQSTIYVNSTLIENITQTGDTFGIFAQEGTAFLDDVTILNMTTGVMAVDFSNITISNSFINDSVSAGISGDSSVFNVINTVIDNATMGVFFRGSTGNVITNSVINDTSSWAFLGEGSVTSIYSTLFDNNNEVVYVYNTGNLFIVNSTISAGSGVNLMMNQDSHIISLNTSFDNSSVMIFDAQSTLTVQWYLHVLVLNASASPVPLADLRIIDNPNGTYDSSFVTDVGGYVNWITITEYMQDSTIQTYFTPYNLTANKGPQDKTVFSNISKSMLVIIQFEGVGVNIDFIRLEYFDGTPVAEGTVLNADQFITIYARGYNISSGLVGDVFVNWSINGGIGILSTPNGTSVIFDAATLGVGNISAEFGPIGDVTGNITVTPGDVMNIIIIPQGPETYSADDTIVYQTFGYDADGNLNMTWVPGWSWLGPNLGIMTQLTPDDYNYSIEFNLADSSFVQVILTTNPTINNVSAVTVNPGVLFEIVIIPGGSETNTTDDVLNFTVGGYDGDGNLNLSWSVSTSWETAYLGNISISGYNISIEFTDVGTGSINISDMSKTDIYNLSKSITVNPGIPYSIYYVSGNGQTGLGGLVLVNPFVVMVEDYDGNPVPNVEINWSLDGWPSGAKGQSLSFYNSLTDLNGEASTVLTLGDIGGVYYVNASNITYTLVGEPVSFSANATVYTIDKILITDGGGNPITDRTLSTDDTITIFVWAYNETVGIFGPLPVNWSFTGGIGVFTSPIISQAQATFDFTTVGMGNIVVEFSNSTVTISNMTGDITVIPGAVVNIILNPSIVSNSTDGSDIFRAVGYDADWNANWTWTPVWGWQGTSLGTLSAIDDYNYTVSYHTVGSDNLRVNLLGYADIDDIADVNVYTGQVASIEIYPWPQTTATADDVGTFSVIGRDADGYTNWSWTPNWTWEGIGLGTLTQIDDYNYTVAFDFVGWDAINVTFSGNPSIYNRTSVFVSSGVVVRIEITPWPSSNYNVGETGYYFAVGYDADGNENWSWNPSWNWNGSGLGALTQVTSFNYTVIFSGAGSDDIIVGVISDPAISNTSFVAVSALTTVDYIVIMDSPGGTGTIVGTMNFGVGEIFTLYAVGFNFTTGYIMDIDVEWTSSDINNGTVVFGPNDSALFTANLTHGGIVTITATNLSLPVQTNITGIFTILDPQVDYITIRDTDGGGGSIVTTASFLEGETDVFHAASYNDTAGYLGDVDVSWESLDTNVGTVSPTSGYSITTFTAGSVSGTTIVTAIYIPGISDSTSTLTVSLISPPPTMDLIIIRDQPGGLGNITTTITFEAGETHTFYVAGYNSSTGQFIGDVAVVWDVASEVGTIDITSGSYTHFSALDRFGSIALGNLSVTHINLTNSTAIIVDLPPIAPQNLDISKVADGNSLNITWTQSIETDVAGYEIYRSETPGGNFTLVQNVSGRSTTTYVDSGLTDGVTYYYRIVAYDGIPNFSPASFEASGTPDTDTDGDGIYNADDDDDDGDDLSDSEELELGTDPLSWDTDGDGHGDKEDKYPLDSTKWKEEAKESALLFILLPIIVLIILLLLILLKKRKPGDEIPPDEELDEMSKEDLDAIEEDILEDDIEDEPEEEPKEDLEDDIEDEPDEEPMGDLEDEGEEVAEEVSEGGDNDVLEELLRETENLKKESPDDTE